MEDKAESLRKRLASIKNNSETPEEANETKKQIAQAKFVFSPFKCIIFIVICNK